MRDFRRIREIASVLSRYGFDDLAGRLGFVSAVRTTVDRVFRHQPPPRLSDAVRLRMAINELGPTFVKLGQMLAAHPELLPPEFIIEFKKFHDEVPPFPFDQVREVFEAETGRAVADVFDAFDVVPLAAASIGQVHSAVMKDGRRVAVKVQRPGITETMDADLRIIRRLASILERSVPVFRQMGAVAVVDEFRRNLMQELDFGGEVRNMVRYREMFADEPGLLVPKPVDEICGPRVIVMDFVDGIKVTDTAALNAAGVDIQKVIETGMRVILRSIFEFGFFHCDPHPGNFFVLADGTVALLDYGTVATVDSRRIDEMVSFMIALAGSDVDGLVNVLVDMDVIGDDTDIRSLRADLSSLLARYRSAALRDVQLATFMGEVMSVARNHAVKVPADLLMVGKAMSIMEGIGAEICPEFKPVEFIRPYLQNIYVERMLDADKQARSLTKLVMDGGGLLKDAPYDIRRILRRIRQGELTTVVRSADDRSRRIERHILTNRAIFAGLFVVFFLSAVVFIDSDAGFRHGAGVFSAVMASVFFVCLMVSMLVHNGRYK